MVFLLLEKYWRKTYRIINIGCFDDDLLNWFTACPLDNLYEAHLKSLEESSINQLNNSRTKGQIIQKQ